MKIVITLSVLSVAAVVLARPNDEKYTDRYDNLDVEEILDNDRLSEPYANCILDKGKCAPEAKELKLHIKEALENFCGNCTEAQKSKTRTTIRFLINRKPEIWEELKAKYDPDNKYSVKYEKELREITTV